MDVKQVEEMLKASMNCVSFAPTHANKTNLTLFKSKYDQHSKKIPGPGPRDVMLMDARLKENAFAFQWHIKYNHKGTLGYTRYFGSAKDVIEFYEKHYSKCDVADRNGYEYYYDTLNVKAGFDVEQYSIFTDDLDKEAIVQKVLAAVEKALYDTYGSVPRFGKLYKTPAHRVEIVKVLDNDIKYWKTSFHLIHTGIKFTSLFAMKSFAHAVVQRAIDYNIADFFYDKPEGKGLKPNESIVDLSFYRRRGEMRMYGSCKKGNINSCLLDPEFPNMNILAFITHCYGDYITHSEAKKYQDSCGYTDKEMLEMFPIEWDEADTTLWDAMLNAKTPNHGKHVHSIKKRQPKMRTDGKIIIDDCEHLNEHLFDVSANSKITKYLDGLLRSTHPNFRVGNISVAAEDQDSVVNDDPFRAVNNHVLNNSVSNDNVGNEGPLKNRDGNGSNGSAFVYIYGGNRTCPHGVHHDSNNASLIFTPAGTALYKCYTQGCKEKSCPVIDKHVPSEISVLLGFRLRSSSASGNVFAQDEDFGVDMSLVKDEWSAQDDLSNFTYQNPGASITELNTWLVHIYPKVNFNGSGYVWFRKCKNPKGHIEYAQLNFYPYQKKCKNLPDTMYVFANGGYRVPIKMSEQFEELDRRQVLKGYSSIGFFPYCKPQDAPAAEIFNTFTGYTFPYEYQPPIQSTNASWKDAYSNPSHIAKCPIFEHWFHLCGKNHEAFVYDVKFMAERLQKPFYKSRTFLSKTGIEGIGKDTQMFTMRDLMGDKYFTMYSNMTELSANFNADMGTNLIVVLNEVEAATGQEKAGLLKYITDQRVRKINEKYIKEIKAEVYTQYFAINNNKCIWRFDGGQARRIVSIVGTHFHSDSKSEVDSQYWKQYHAWLNNTENLRQLFNFLTNLDLSDYNSAKREVWMEENKLTGIQEGFDSIPLHALCNFHTNLPAPLVTAHPAYFDRNAVFSAYKEYVATHNFRFPLTSVAFNKFIVDHGGMNERSINKTIQTEEQHPREIRKKYVCYEVTRSNIEKLITNFCKFECTLEKFQSIDHIAPLEDCEL